MRIADTTFGLDRYAWALLALLSTWETDFAHFNEQAKLWDVCIQTDVHQEGEARWGRLVMPVGSLGLRKVIAFGRDVHRDEIVVQSWQLAPAGDLGDQESKIIRFDPGQLMNAALFIRSELARAYESQA